MAAFVRRFPRAHLAIGLAGNALFVVGSVLFVLHRQNVGVFLFLVGSCGMFLGSLGEALRALGRRRLQSYGLDPPNP